MSWYVLGWYDDDILYIRLCFLLVAEGSLKWRVRVFHCRMHNCSTGPPKKIGVIAVLMAVWVLV